MAVNLLIDTNILKRLVSKTEFSHHLKQLNYWVTQRYVGLLVPEVLRTEWEKHRELESQAIESALREHKEEARTRKIFKDFSAEFLEQKIEDLRRLLRSQLDMIDVLLNTNGIKIEMPLQLYAKISNQRKAKKMPFWNTKKDHTNDAELIFSALNFLNDEKEKVLYFISDNIHEFTKRPELVLHPDISENYPEIQCYYFTDFADIYESFDELKIPRFPGDEANRKSGIVQNTIYVDKEKPILDQVYDYLLKRFVFLNFIPKKFWAEHYPFIKNEYYTYQRKPFVLVTDNEEVYDLLTKIKVEQNEITGDANDYIRTPDDEKKIKAIFKCLLTNLLEFVAFKDKEAKPFVYSEFSRSCLCSLCSYKRLDFSSLLNRVTEPVTDDSNDPVHARIRYAYGQYKIGRFVEATHIFKDLYEELKDKKDLTYYIIAFNLRSLGPMLRTYYWEDRSIQNLAEELIRIDLEKTFKDCDHSFENHSLLEYIHNKEFISDSFKGLHEIVNAITDHFYGQTTGFNQNTRRLREIYFSADAFLNLNSIIYDTYTDFERLTLLYTHGLLASYGGNPLMSGKLIHFNDLLLEKLMLSGNAEDIQKFLTRFKLKEIVYQQTDSDGNTFVDRFENLLDQHKATIASFDKGNNLNRRYFWDSYSEIIYNSMALMAMLKLDGSQINRIATKILILLEGENDLLYFKLLKHIRFFLYRKQRELSVETIERYYKLALKSKIFHTDNYFEAIVQIVQEKKTKIDLSAEEFGVVISLFFDKPEEESTIQSWFSIGYIFSSIKGKSQKDEIRSFVNKSLTDHFDGGKYYLATMFDIITNDPHFHEKYVAEMEQIIAKGIQPRPFMSKSYYIDSRIDNFLNYCLRFNQTLSDTFKNKITVMGSYYNWLVDMENFNYSFFDTDWLYSHFTVSFKTMFRQSKALKNHLLNLIRKDPDADIERIFVLIYCIED